MNTKQNHNEKTKLSTSEKWLFAGHALLASGTLFISVGNLLKYANDGRINEVNQTHSTQRPAYAQHDNVSAMDYFRSRG
jgi:hypothetical protein